MLLELKPEIIYGPVKSRRLGSSLGINILPGRKKVCSFNCLYCQYGLVDSMTRDEAGNAHFPSTPEVLEAVEVALKNLNPLPVYLTFSGNGEATLHPHFKEMVEGVCELRNRWSPTSKTAILSNSTMVKDPAVREALAMLDVRIMKLDAGTDEMYAYYNRPARGITLEEIVAGLADLEKVTIQSLFTKPLIKGSEGNFTPGHLEAWVQQIKRISPINVQLYTLDRESPTRSLIPLELGELLHIRSLLHIENISSQVYANKEKNFGLPID